ncbi:unnamed protein product [Symbiodinium necroappetens]|uniref:C3H1-type domain-containing protein n=1 Tax=Symbiodinium necroappetens TaxID=1628268 RepID=A0A812TDU8_9DINO|nr:unnamed protein product [Symbiodinium necroappetens]
MTETWQQSYLYPGPLLVRNTFIDDPLGRDCLTEGFLHERQAFSCPVSRISEPGSGVEVFEADKAVPEAPPEDAESSDCSTSCTDGLQTLPPAAPTAQTVPPPDVSDFSLPKFGVRLSELPLPSEGAQHTNALAPDLSYSSYSCGYFLPAEGIVPAGPPEPLPPGWEPTLPPQVLRLEEALKEEASVSQVHQAAALAAAGAIGASHEEQVAAANAFAASASTVMQGANILGEPSAGSTGHYQGQCRPCAFATTKGCASGKECQFCHLCAPGEKKRRQKAKRAFFGALAEMQRALPESAPPSGASAQSMPKPLN